MDSSGDGLHKRGYRTLAYSAPIKETLAAAMLRISRWAPGKNLIDPFCGSGTIPIEAALMAMNKAPGLDRNFDCQEWPIIPKKIWYSALEEARSLIKPVTEKLIQGYDINPEAVSLANYHAKQAGVSEAVHLQVRDVKDISSKAKYGFIITNPPYGQRLGEKKENSLLYHTMGESFKRLPPVLLYNQCGS